MTGSSPLADGTLRRVWQARGPAGTGFAVLVLACVFLAVAGPRLDIALRSSALRQAIGIATPTARAISGNIDATGLDADLGKAPTAQSIDATGAVLRSQLAKGGLPLASGDWSGLATPESALTAGLPAKLTTNLETPRVHLVYRSGLSDYGTLTAGRLPSAASVTGTAATFEIAVTTATAARYQLHPGSQLKAGALTLTVTGVIRPLQGSSAFWTTDPGLAAPVLTASPANGGTTPPPYWSAAFLIGAAEVPSVEQAFSMPSITVSWVFPVDVNAISADGAAALQSVLTKTLPVSGFIGLGAEPAGMSSGLSPILGAYSGQDSAAATVLRLLAVSLAVIGVVTVLLGGQALERRQAPERDLLAARGASRWQTAGAAARAAAVPALPGAVLGAVLAVLILPGDDTVLSWWLGALTLAAALGCGPVLALREYRRGGFQQGAATVAAGRGLRRAAAWRRAAAEAALVVLAAGCLAALRTGSGGAFTSLAPVLAAVPVAIIVTRGYPLAVAGLARLARRRRGATVFTGLAGAAADAPGTLLTGFALVLALAVAAFGFLVGDAVGAGVTSASWQEAGSDVTVNAQLASQVPSQATVRAVTAVPGVRHATLVSLVQAEIGGTQMQVAVVEPQQYAALVAGSPLPSFPAGALARTAATGTLPALVTSAGAAALSGSHVTMLLDQKSFTFTVTGSISGLSGVADNGGFTTQLGGGSTTDASDEPVLVVPSWAIGPGAAGDGPASGAGAVLAPPDFLLVTGTDSAQLLAVIHRQLPGLPSDAIASRAAIAAALRDQPLAHDEDQAIAAAAAAAGALAAAVLVIAVAGAARSRRATVARLRLMGSPARQRGLVELTQTLPLVVAAALGGVACAWVLGPLVGPALNLSAFTGVSSVSGILPTVPVTARWAPLGAAVAGLIILAVLALAGTARAADPQEELA